MTKIRGKSEITHGLPTTQDS